MKNIYLVRHGEALDDIEDTFGGWADDPLTQRGLDLAEELAKELVNLGIKKIYSSPLKRARVTAEIIGKNINLPVEVIEDLKERNRYGVLTGMKIKEAEDKYPDMVAQVKNYLITIRGAESYENYKKRVLKVIRQIIRKDKEDLLIVCHNGTFRVVMWELLKRRDFHAADLHGFIHIKEDKGELSLDNSKGLKFN